MSTSTTAPSIEPHPRILRSKETALWIAIHTLKKQDAECGPEYRSALRAGLEMNLAALRAGQRLEIDYSR